MKKAIKSTTISAIILSLGIFGAGFFIGKAFYYSKRASQTITVKGIAERIVKADLAVWEIDYREVGSNLSDITQHLQNDQKQVIDFLKDHGIKDEDLEIQPVKVEDRLANIYTQSNEKPDTTADRFVATSGLVVRSTRVELVQQLNQLTSVLLERGVPLAFDKSLIFPNPSYYFTQLDALRPEILAEATTSARLVAKKFAKDLGVNLVGIQRASQGVFQIMSRDMTTMNPDWSSSQSALGTIDKKIHLVTTVDYQIK